MAEPTTWTVSPFISEVQPISASDEEIRRHLADAELQPLLPALAYATGDLGLLREDLRPDPVMMAMPSGTGFSDEQADAIRELALRTLIRFRDEGCRPAPPPSDEDLLRILEHAVGGDTTLGGSMADYLPLLEEELAHRGEDRRAPTWRKDEIAPDLDFRVLVIGAGMSGLLAGYRLKQAGIDFVIVEKNDDVGGTWYENTYPGCRVDNPNHNYSYSFAQRHDWPYHYSTQPVLHRYFRECADAFGLWEHIRFRTEVLSATWHEDDHRWSVVVRDAEGAEHTLVADAVISAVGQLNRPHYPEIPGRDTFAGPAFHSARWRHDVDLRGKRVAVIGTGASAMQFVPEIAPVVGELLVFQRTPAWMVPTPDYHAEVPPGLRWLYEHVPAYSEIHRFCIFWRMGDGVLATVQVDPDWDVPGSVSAANAMVQALFTDYIKQQFADRPDLLEVVVPNYPPGAKRMIRDNGVWASALKRDNVRLITTGIREITPSGLVTVDGTAHDVDVIIYGTGFTASKFLAPMKVTGRDGVDLHEHWQGEPRAYLGITVPGFPNLFCLYGPNTNIVINGSIIYFSECGVRYIMGLLEMALRRGKRAVDVRREVHDRFNEEVDRANELMAWGASDVNSWYKNASGRVSQNWPFTLLEYWQRTLRPDPDEYVLTG
ncbi:MAG: NAD(P)/FAD-dependent oxidoreductase [Thermoanaerobacterales bacterium]|nr:NAD(P)/FAD-dependent oxidoreductase [Thermoanaerobacterales bacterium]